MARVDAFEDRVDQASHGLTGGKVDHVSGSRSWHRELEVWGGGRRCGLIVARRVCGVERLTAAASQGNEARERHPAKAAADRGRWGDLKGWQHGLCVCSRLLSLAAAPGGDQRHARWHREGGLKHAGRWGSFLLRGVASHEQGEGMLSAGRGHVEQPLYLVRVGRLLAGLRVGRGLP